MQTQSIFHFVELSSQDVLMFKDLNYLFGEAFHEPETYSQKQPDDDYLRSLLEKDHVIALVALDGDKIVGGLVAYVLEKFEQDRREIYIYDLAVKQEYRRQKVASGLLSYMKGVARKKKAYVIFVQADEGDMPAIRLYEKFGKRETALHFDIRVD